MRTRHVKRDRNHGEIQALFIRIGCSWLDLAKVGEGCPDALVGRCGSACLIEIKDGELPPSKRKLRDSQTDFKLHWKGCKIFTVINKNEALSAASEMGWVRA